MRKLILFAGLLIGAATAVTAAQADPYRYCAQYGGRDGGENCGFQTLAQCRAAIAGLGGFCRQNTFYDGRPVRTPQERGRQSWR